jgi:signal transduction histidine kinase
VAAALARLLSRKLVENVERAVSSVQNMKASGVFSGRIALSGSDEVSYLTGEFDRLLDDLEAAKARAISTERLQAQMQLAREVAHNIKSPSIAIQMVLPMLQDAPEHVRKVLSDSAKEIKQLSEKLRKQAEGVGGVMSELAATELIYVPALLDEVISRKQHEYSDRKDVSIVLQIENSGVPLFVKAAALDLRGIISNLVNNAVESKLGDSVLVIVRSKLDNNFCNISVSDNGVGIPEELVSSLGQKRITFKGDHARGVGLVHAFNKVAEIGGRVAVKSAIGGGTTIRILLPILENVKEFEPKIDIFKNEF